MRSVLALSGVLTPDTAAPTFSTIGHVSAQSIHSLFTVDASVRCLAVPDLVYRTLQRCALQCLAQCRQQIHHVAKNQIHSLHGGECSEMSFQNILHYLKPVTMEHVPCWCVCLVQMLSLSQDTQLFNLRLPIAVNEPSVLHYAVYRRVSCISAEPSIEELRSAARLPASKCACTSRTDCDPVAYGNDTLAEGVLANVYTIQGLVPPNPFDFLRGAGEQLLTCRNGAYI